MKNCLRLPRVILPRGSFEAFAVPAADCRITDREYWSLIERDIGDAPSAYRFIIPEVFAGENDEERIQAMKETMYLALEDDEVEKLVRGSVLTVRTLPSGAERRGLLYTLDLEDYTCKRGETSLARPVEEADAAMVELYKTVRKNTPIEFPHIVFLYRDKKNRLTKHLKGEHPEELYSFDLHGEGGSLRGSFLEPYLAMNIMKDLYSRGETSFVAVEGIAQLNGAKKHWNEVKKKLTPSECMSHPARFVLAEFVNVCDDAVLLHPVHRAVAETETEALCDFLQKNVRCKREGNVLSPAVQGAEGVRRIDELLSKYLHANGGRLLRVTGEKRLRELAKETDCVGILFKEMDKGDVFDDVRRGILYPEGSVTLGERAKRYCLEGRETSYD